MHIIKGEFQSIGDNEIDIPKVIRLWDDRFIIYRIDEQYELMVYRKNSGSKLFRSAISKDTAQNLIESLELKQYLPGFSDAFSAWNTYGYEIQRKRPSKN